MTIKLVPDGLEILRSTLAGQSGICFTSVQLGNGSDAGEEADRLNNPLLTLPISSVDMGDTFVTLHVTFNNAGVSAPFHAKELGVWAEDSEKSGQAVLYAYGFTEESTADYIPASDDRVLESALDILVYIGDAENVTAAISQSISYVTNEAFNAFASRTDNPHRVTKKQVGLENVPNVSTNDQTPTYQEAENLEEIKSGEKLSVAFGKIKVAMRALISHLSNKENPHGITAAAIQAASSSHKHSTSDINSGILAVGRGGTGVETKEALAKLVADNFPDGSVSTEMMGDDSVTKGKIKNDAVSTEKIENGAVTYEKTTGLQKELHCFTGTLTVAGWSNKSQSLSITGMTESSHFVASPNDTAGWAAAADAMLYPPTAEEGRLIFACESVPAAAIAITVYWW